MAYCVQSWFNQESMKMQIFRIVLGLHPAFAFKICHKEPKVWILTFIDKNALKVVVWIDSFGFLLGSSVI